MSNQRETW